MIDLSTAFATDPPPPAPAPLPPSPPPATVDLDVYYPLALSATTIARGTFLTIDYYVENHGNLESPPSTSGVYLSVDGFITTADIYLGSGPVNMVAGLAYSQASVTLQIPASLAAGPYYIGVIADYANSVSESDESNNASTSTLVTVTIPAPPPPAPPPLPQSSMDLYILQQPQLSATTVVRGNTLTVNYEADHSDSADVPASVAGIFLSTDSTITTDDIYLGSNDIPAMAMEVWHSAPQSTAVTIPSTLAAGTYYIGVIADYNGRINEHNEINNASEGAAVTVTGTIGHDVLGTFFNETLSGTAADEAFFAMGGNDTITGGSGNDTIDGGTGLDTAIFTGSSTAFAGRNADSSLQVNGADGHDTLVNVERLRFADGTLAFDLDGTAGAIVKLIGAVLGPAQSHDPALIAYGMNLAADGGRLPAIEQFALDYRLGPSPSHAALIDLLYTNLVGVHPSQSIIDTYSALLDSGAASDVSLTQFAMDHEYNLANIGFAGLQQTGVFFY